MLVSGLCYTKLCPPLWSTLSHQLTVSWKDACTDKFQHPRYISSCKPWTHNALWLLATKLTMRTGNSSKSRKVPVTVSWWNSDSKTQPKKKHIIIKFHLKWTNFPGQNKTKDRWSLLVLGTGCLAERNTIKFIGARRLGLTGHSTTATSLCCSAAPSAPP